MNERIQMLFDRLNLLQVELTEKMTIQGKLNKEETEDSLLDLLIMAYVFGNTDANESLGTDISVNIGKMEDALYRDFDGRNFAQRVADYIFTGSIPDIMRVAETEMHRDYSAGVYDTAKDSNKKVNKTWVTMQDDRVRETHFYLQGISVGIDERFYAIDGDSARYPGDFSKAENNVNCRCYLSVK